MWTLQEREEGHSIECPFYTFDTMSDYLYGHCLFQAIVLVSYDDPDRAFLFTGLDGYHELAIKQLHCGFHE